MCNKVTKYQVGWNVKMRVKDKRIELLPPQLNARKIRPTTMKPIR